MFVNALVELEASAALRVPTSAVFLFGDKRYVFVEETPGRYRRQVVDAGPEREGQVGHPLGGLTAGEKVVAEGSLHLLKYFKPVAAAEKQAAK